MRLKFLAILLTATSALIFTGCDGGRAQMGPKDTNVLGIVSIQPESYTSTGPGTIPVSTDELYDRNNYSGNRISLLWGLVTIKDY